MIASIVLLLLVLMFIGWRNRGAMYGFLLCIVAGIGFASLLVFGILAVASNAMAGVL